MNFFSFCMFKELFTLPLFLEDSFPGNRILSCEEHFLNILCFLLLYGYIWDSEESRGTTMGRRREDLNVWRGFTLPFTSTSTSKPNSEWKAYLMPFVYLDFPNDRPFTPSVVVQSTLHVWFFAIPQTAACQASLSFTISQSLLKFMCIWVSDAF